MEILKLFVPYGPAWLGGVLLALIAFYFGKQFLEEYKLQNERKSALDIKREERKQDEVKERAQRDRERSEMEGRIAAQMERSNSLMEAMKTLMESVVASNDVLHSDLVNRGPAQRLGAQPGSQPGHGGEGRPHLRQG